MKQKIVVMGGSFNPPTIAHMKLMQVAMKHIGAEKGIFVPVSLAYLKRKLRKLKGRQVAFPDQLRLEMLNAMCAQTSGISTSEIELSLPRGRTYGTMVLLQEENPDAELYFLVGADKIDLVKKWIRKGDFLERFKLVLFSRDDIDLKEITDQALDSIVMVAQPKDINEISSTRIRDYFIQGKLEQAKDDLNPDVYKLLEKYTIEDFPIEIEYFKEKYEFLSNDFIAPFEWKDNSWMCVEAAFQAERCKDPQKAHVFLKCGGSKARQRAHKIEPREDWESVKNTIMLELLMAKFKQYPELAKELLKTDTAILVSGHNNEKDLYWGRDLYTYEGENQLGKALMQVRENLKREQEA